MSNKNSHFVFQGNKQLKKNSGLQLLKKTNDHKQEVKEIMQQRNDTLSSRFILSSRQPDPERIEEIKE